MKDWFDGLEPRERLTLIAGGVILGLTLVWVLLISPLYVSAGARATQVSELKDDVNRARQLRQVILQQSNNGPGSSASDQPLMITLERTARELGLQVEATRPMDPATVRITFESAPFDVLVRWMGVLESQHGLQIDMASLDNLDIPGMVDAQLTVKRPG